MLMARSLWEADVYVSFQHFFQDPAGAPPEARPMKLGENLVEGPDSWTYQSPIGDIVIPYVSEKTTIQVGAPFGLGRSRLLDAVQWVTIGHAFNERALTDMMTYAGEPDPFSFDYQHTEKRRHIRVAWDLAIDATLQAMAFLPEGDHGGDRVPEADIWSEFGANALRADPHLVTRARLDEDLDEFRGLLEDFDRTYAPKV